MTDDFDFAKMVDTINRDTHGLMCELYKTYKSNSEAENWPTEEKNFYARCADYLGDAMAKKYGENWKEALE